MKRTVLIALLALAAGSCKKSDTTTTPVDTGRGGNGILPGGCVEFPLDCSDVMCTAQFADVNLQVKDSIGNPVTVDSFVVTEPNGAALPLSNAGLAVWGYPNAGVDGNYTILNDAWVDGRQGTYTAVRARGYIAGAEVFNELITVTADCCHVSRMNGVDTITLP